MKKEKEKTDIKDKDVRQPADETSAAPAENEAGTPEPETQPEGDVAEEDELAKAKKEIESLRDQYLRKVAEFDNYQKRTAREKVELVRNGGENVIKEMLPVLDDFDRAWANIENTDDVNTLRDGVGLIMKKLRDTLAAQGLKAIETEGKDFDTDYHEAIATCVESLPIYSTTEFSPGIIVLRLPWQSGLPCR